MRSPKLAVKSGSGGVSSQARREQQRRAEEVLPRGSSRIARGKGGRGDDDGRRKKSAKESKESSDEGVLPNCGPIDQFPVCPLVTALCMCTASKGCEQHLGLNSIHTSPGTVAADRIGAIARLRSRDKEQLEQRTIRTGLKSATTHQDVPLHLKVAPF